MLVLVWCGMIPMYVGNSAAIAFITYCIYYTCHFVENILYFFPNDSKVL